MVPIIAPPECSVTPHSPTSVHVFHSLLRLPVGLKLHVGVAFGQVRVDAVHWHVNHLDLAVSGENLLDVFLQNRHICMKRGLILRPGAFQPPWMEPS